MSKTNAFYTAEAETKRLLDIWQDEADHYGDLSPEQEEAELKQDKGYQEFIDKVNDCPF